MIHIILILLHNQQTCKTDFVLKNYSDHTSKN